ncbi:MULTISPECIES: DUF4261 domain-containing protein [unclassified Variovorax]|uniref:DUF4261 domain-containing protein n=1 Tax=unclassified Variovorax TaxID=663243 RepID=UPI0008B633FF|nr:MULTISPECIES: DUF4261 domain-containing protein [unclassified Variovorax]SEJ90816.1 protein of unknown function [Variovorax sp. OK202]SFD08332.1 protein of unknown function [Variovorax sp. OK212]
MSIFSRFFGRKDEPADAGALVANPDLEDPVALTVLFPDAQKIDIAALGQALRAYHRSTGDARCEVSPDPGAFIALVGWRKHVVRLVGFDAPMPADALEACVAPAHYPQELKAQVRAHRGHVILYYAGREASVLEQYVALATVAGALARLGALAVVNEAARTSMPAAVFDADAETGNGGDSIELLRELDLPALYCGFVKYEVEGVQGVWMRTHGADRFGHPDFAVLAEGHHEGQTYFQLFGNVLRYLVDSGAEMGAGHTMQVGEDRFMRLRAPAETEYFLDGPGTVMVAEMIGADEIAQRPH